MKKGISLIVLVITIIVMIIIAGAIILSLSASNVTGRANLATLLSDRANYQAAYAVKYAENTNEDGSVTAVTAADIGLDTATSPYGTWALVDGEVTFTIKDDASVEALGLTDEKIATYSWLSKAGTASGS